MKIKSAVFTVSAPDLVSCPPASRPEFAFIGRSNVGKSSLINLLAERRQLAMVSNTPGKTKLINFFLINDTWSLVDLPGYGYANVTKATEEGFQRAIMDYLTERPTLAGVFVLIDSRLPPQAIDLEFLDWLALHCPVPSALVFTKSDKQSPTATLASTGQFLQRVAKSRHGPQKHFTTSSKTKHGRKELLDYIAEVLATADVIAPDRVSLRRQPR